MAKHKKPMTKEAMVVEMALLEAEIKRSLKAEPAQIDAAKANLSKLNNLLREISIDGYDINDAYADRVIKLKQAIEQAQIKSKLQQSSKKQKIDVITLSDTDDEPSNSAVPVVKDVKPKMKKKLSPLPKGYSVRLEALEQEILSLLVNKSSKSSINAKMFELMHTFLQIPSDHGRARDRWADRLKAIDGLRKGFEVEEQAPDNEEDDDEDTFIGGDAKIPMNIDEHDPGSESASPGTFSFYVNFFPAFAVVVICLQSLLTHYSPLSLV